MNEKLQEYVEGCLALFAIGIVFLIGLSFAAVLLSLAYSISKQ